MAKMASLILEDGSTFKGLLFGADVSVSGEVGELFSHFLQSLLVYRLFFPVRVATVAHRKSVIGIFPLPVTHGSPEVPRWLFTCKAPKL